MTLYENCVPLGAPLLRPQATCWRCWILIGSGSPTRASGAPGTWTCRRDTLVVGNGRFKRPKSTLLLGTVRRMAQKDGDVMVRISSCICSARTISTGARGPRMISSRCARRATSARRFGGVTNCIIELPDLIRKSSPATLRGLRNLVGHRNGIRGGRTWCGRENSNFHGVSPTSTSSLRVYHSATTAPGGRRAV